MYYLIAYLFKNHIFVYKIRTLYLINSFIHQYSALEAGLAGTRAQSCDRYGSGTLHLFFTIFFCIYCN